MKTEPTQLDFACFLRAIQPRLVAFIHSLVLNASDAEDVFQETVLALWEKRSSYDSTRDFGAWAVGIAQNKVFDYYKSQKKQPNRFGEELLQQLAHRQSAPESTEYLQAKQKALATCIKQLSPRQGELLQRCYRGSEAVSDVAKSLERSTGSVYSSLRHIRLRLLECVARAMSRGLSHD